MYAHTYFLMDKHIRLLHFHCVCVGGAYVCAKVSSLYISRSAFVLAYNAASNTTDLFTKICSTTDLFTKILYTSLSGSFAHRALDRHFYGVLLGERADDKLTSSAHLGNVLGSVSPVSPQDVVCCSGVACAMGQGCPT